MISARLLDSTVVCMTLLCALQPCTLLTEVHMEHLLSCLNVVVPLALYFYICILDVFQTLPAHLHCLLWPGPAPALPVPTRPHPHQGSWLELQGHVLQEGHEVGRATLHLLQVLELAVLLLCVLGVGMGGGVRQWGAKEGLWA